MDPKDKQLKDENVAFPETEKEFYQLEIADLNRKLARLRLTLEESEVRIIDLQNDYIKLDTDRSDVIEYLKRVIDTKNGEITEMNNNIKLLENLREEETADFKRQKQLLEDEFSIMKNQLTSEKRILASKLNTLEEFRAIRDDLMEKFETQDKNYKAQEIKYQRIIYTTEKKFNISKDKLIKELEARTLKLSQDFHDTTDLRIAATTHRVIRENIAINHELNNILENQTNLSQRNEQYEKSNKETMLAKEVAEVERDDAINKNVVYIKIIKRLTSRFNKLKAEVSNDNREKYYFEALLTNIEKLKKGNEDLLLQNRILEQNLEFKINDIHKTKMETSSIIKENRRLKQLLREAATMAMAVLKLDQWNKEESERNVDVRCLLTPLFDLLMRYKKIQRADSIETICSFTKLYTKGDLGFTPKREKSKLKTLNKFDVISEMSIINDDKHFKSNTISSDETSNKTFTTVPSLKIMSETAEEMVQVESFASFAKSTQSTESEIKHIASLNSGEEPDIQTLLAISRMNLLESIKQDLAALKTESKDTLRASASNKTFSSFTDSSASSQSLQQNITKLDTSPVTSAETLNKTDDEN